VKREKERDGGPLKLGKGERSCFSLEVSLLLNCIKFWGSKGGRRKRSPRGVLM